MPQYRALRPLYLRKLIYTGEVFESDLPPGRNWEPLDDEARAAVQKYRSENSTVLEMADKFDPAPRAYAAVEIPDDWQAMSGPKRRALAMKLGAQATVKHAESNSFIQAELDRRAHKTNAA